MNERRDIHVITRGVLIVDNCILLCRTVGLDDNFYFLPGGHVEPQENAIEALEREFIEETGKKIRITQFLGCFEYRFNPKTPICHQHEYNLIFQVSSAEIESSSPLEQCEELVELHFIPLSKLTTIAFHPAPLIPLLLQWHNEQSLGGFHFSQE